MPRKDTATSRPPVWLVIPCFEESRRLPPFLDDLITAVAESRLPLVIQVVDDGSSESERAGTRAEIDSRRPGSEVILRPMLEEEHQGKGGAILSGWKLAPTDTRFYGFVDADGAVPAKEVIRVARTALEESDSSVSYFATRKNTETTAVERLPLRRINGRIYAWLVNFVLGTSIYDPACGLKFVSADFYDNIGSLLREKDWALDLELLARMQWHRFPFVEVPVNWKEKGGSKIVSGDALRIVGELFRIKWRSRNWH